MMEKLRPLLVCVIHNDAVAAIAVCRAPRSGTVNYRRRAPKRSSLPRWHTSRSS